MGVPADGSTGRLDGVVTVITGASRGIGAATAKLLAERGAPVAIAARDGDALASVATEIEHRGGSVTVVPTDVTDPGSVERMIARTVDAFGRVDAAFNNAGGGYRPVPLADLTVDAFDTAVRVNLRGVFLSMKYEIPAMVESGGGSIVNMSSTVGVLGWQGIGAYVAAKHGVVGLTRSAALDYAERGVRVNAVAPGSILTERILALSDEQRAPIADAIPVHRIGRVEEVAATVAWLCSPEAAFITGAVIPIDGGQLARA